MASSQVCPSLTVSLFAAHFHHLTPMTSLPFPRTLLSCPRPPITPGASGAQLPGAAVANRAAESTWPAPAASAAGHGATTT